MNDRYEEIRNLLKEFVRSFNIVLVTFETKDTFGFSEEFLKSVSMSYLSSFTSKFLKLWNLINNLNGEEKFA